MTKSLKARLLFSMMLVVMSSILVNSISVLKNQQALAKEAAASQLDSISGMVVTNVTAALLFADPDAASQTLEGLKSIGDIQGAQIYSADGEPFARYGGDISDFSNRQLVRYSLDSGSSVVIDSDAALHSYMPVSSEGEIIGLVFLVNNLKGMQDSLETFYRIVFIAGLAAFLCSVVLVLWLQNFFTSPLSQMITVIKQITHSKDYSQRSPLMSTNEFNMLSQNFNLMIAEVEERGIQLQTINSGLEIRVTERTAELESALKIANESSQAKSQFMAVMSHEVRTPLNGIMGFLEILNLRSFDKEVETMLNAVNESAKALLQILNDILDFSKMDANETEIEHVEFKLVEMVQSVIDANAALLKKKDVKISCIHAGFPDGFVGDAVKIRQVVNNFIGNAVKFTDHGSIRVELSAQDMGSECLVNFRCEDTGIGIPPDRITAIFLPFVQVDSSITRKYGGTGLGLAICKQLIELVNGKYGVDSTLGKGTCFWFSVPLTRVASSLVSTIKTALPATGALKLRGRILVAEDNAMNQVLIRSLMNLLGQQCDICGTGLDAVNMASINRYDVILMDYHMPKLDGIEATRIIRAQNAGALNQATPIIALTADIQPQVNTQFKMAGSNATLIKPFSIQKLEECLNTWLGANAVRDDAAAAQQFSEDLAVVLDPKILEQIASMSANEGRTTVNYLVKVFLEQTPMLIARIVDAVEKADNEELFTAAHSLKSGSGCIGAMKLSEISRRLEYYGRNADATKAPGLTEKLKDCYLETAKAVSQTFEAHQWVSPPGRSSVL